MSANRVLESLRRVEIFHGLSDKDLVQLASLCKVWKVPTSHTIFREGDEGTVMYIIQEGGVRVSIHTRTDSGEDSQGTINTLFAGQSFGEMVLLDGVIRSATVTVAQPSTLLLLEGTDFGTLCQRSPHIGYRVMRNLASDLAYKLRSSNLLLRGDIPWKHDELGAG